MLVILFVAKVSILFDNIISNLHKCYLDIQGSVRCRDGDCDGDGDGDGVGDGERCCDEVQL